MKPGPREIAFAMLLLAMPLGAWHFLFRPQNQRDAELRQQIAQKQDRLRAVNRATAAIGDLQKEIASLSGAIDIFQSKLPSDKEIDQVLQELWKIAETNQLTTKSVRTLPRSPENLLAGSGGQHAEQPISMQLEGDFHGFYGFLQALENRPRIMRVRNMTLTRGPKVEGSVTASIVMSIFFEEGSEKRG
jgi:type IV pilus assembly protein PilO